MMEVDFRAILADDTDLKALVSTRIYPTTYAQGAASPAVRYRKVAGTIGLTMRGSDGLGEDLMQVDVRATTALSAFAVKDAIIAALHAYSGRQGDTEFQLVWLNQDRGVDFEKTDAEQFHTASIDFNVAWRAA